MLILDFDLRRSPFKSLLSHEALGEVAISLSNLPHKGVANRIGIRGTQVKQLAEAELEK